MASDKQIKHIKDLCRWKGVEYNELGVQAMETMEASAYIDELKALKSVKQSAVVKTVTADSLDMEVPRYNGMRAGLAMKVAAQHFNPTGPGFSKEVLRIYEAFNNAEAAIKAVYPEVAK